jgi:hypothetical protein
VQGILRQGRKWHDFAVRFTASFPATSYRLQQGRELRHSGAARRFAASSWRRPLAYRVGPSCWQTRRRFGPYSCPPCPTSSPDCSASPNLYLRTCRKPPARSGCACWRIVESGSTKSPLSWESRSPTGPSFSIPARPCWSMWPKAGCTPMPWMRPWAWISAASTRRRDGWRANRRRRPRLGSKGTPRPCRPLPLPPLSGVGFR